MSNFRQLPMLASRLFLWGNQDKIQRYRELFKKFKIYLLELIGFMHQQITLLTDSGKYRVRFEFFCKTKDFGNDVNLPEIRVEDLIWVCHHSKVEKHLRSEISAIGQPLRDLYNHMEVCENSKLKPIQMWDALGKKLGPNRMTTLIYCLERAVQSMSIINNSQYGRITAKIWDKLDSERRNSDIFFSIPSKCVVEIKEMNENTMCLNNANIFTRNTDEHLSTVGNNDANNSVDLDLVEAPEESENEIEPSRPSTVYHLLKNTLYSYKRINLSNRLTESDLKKLPRHTQTLGGQMSKDTILPKGEEHLKARIAQAFFEFSETVGNPNQNGIPNVRRLYSIPVFQRRYFRYSRYKTKSADEINAFFDKLSKIVWEAYDISWWTAWKQRKWYRTKNEMNYETAADMSLDKFPTSKHSFDVWHQSQISSTSATLVQSGMHESWISNTAIVTTSAQLFDYCFMECDVSKKNRWNKMLSVRIFKHVCCLLRSVESYLRGLPDHNAGTIDMWRITYFMERLFISMSTCRKRGVNDISKFIVWDIRSKDKKYWSWQKIRPILVLDRESLEPEELPDPISQMEEPLTIVSGKIYSSLENHMFPFESEAEKRKSPGGRPAKDKLFQIIKPPSYKKEKYDYQLNMIIALRILISFHEKLHLKTVNIKNCSKHLVFNNRSIQFGKIFGSSKKAFVDCMKNCKRTHWIDPNTENVVKKEDGSNETTRKLTPIEKIALMNQKHWDSSTNDELKIFVDDTNYESGMKRFIEEGDIAQALRLAHCGIITEDFLVKLIDLREKYEEIKGEDDSKIRRKLGIDWSRKE